FLCAPLPHDPSQDAAVTGCRSTGKMDVPRASKPGLVPFAAVLKSCASQAFFGLATAHSVAIAPAGDRGPRRPRRLVRRHLTHPHCEAAGPCSGGLARMLRSSAGAALHSAIGAI